MKSEVERTEERWESGYRAYDRERDRRKKGDFWRGLEAMSSGVALMADWNWAFGSAVVGIEPFLRPTGEQATSFPCPACSPCGCRHSIGEVGRLGLVATCSCDGEWECEAVRVEPRDILFHGIEFERFGDAIRRALGFAESSGSPYVSAGLREIGMYAAAAAPVYLSLADSGGLLRALTRLLAMRDGPFLVLTPTGCSWGAEVEALARPHGGGHVALSSVLELGCGGAFIAKGTLEPMLGEFARRVVSLRDSGGMLKNIHREIARVGKDVEELRGAKQRLEKMLADGMFAFTKKVDPTSFKVLCTILAEGDVSKAGRRLGIGDPMMRYHLRQWKERGGAYGVMLELVRWRKKVGRKETVALNESVLHEKAETTDYPGLLSDVLDGLLSMTSANWQELAEELAELVRPAVSAQA